MIRCLAALSPLLALPAAPAPAFAAQRLPLNVDCDKDDGHGNGQPCFVTARDVKGGERVLMVILSLSGPATHDIHFIYDLMDGTANAGQDYAPVTGGQGVIPAGHPGGYVPVQIYADGLVEGEEHLLLKLRFVSGAIVADGEALITIEANAT